MAKKVTEIFASSSCAPLIHLYCFCFFLSLILKNIRVVRHSVKFNFFVYLLKLLFVTKYSAENFFLYFGTMFVESCYRDCFVYFLFHRKNLISFLFSLLLLLFHGAIFYCFPNKDFNCFRAKRKSVRQLKKKRKKTVFFFN